MERYISYILYNEQYDKYYIGQTNNLDIRLKQHNEGKYGWTKAYRPWTVIYKKEHKNRSLAVQEERHLKSFKSKEKIKDYINLKIG